MNGFPGRQPITWFFSGATIPSVGQDGDRAVHTIQGDVYFKRNGLWKLYGSNAYFIQGKGIDGSVATTSPANGDMLQYDSTLLGGAGGWKAVRPTSWTAYSPTVTSLSGSITTLGTVIGRYALLGKTVFLHIEIPITTLGSAGGFIMATLPAGLPGLSGQYFVQMGKEVAVLSATINGNINPFFDSTKVLITRYDGAFVGGDGYRLVLDGVYETN